MQQFRNLFVLNKIYFKQTYTQIFYQYLLIGIGLFLATQAGWRAGNAGDTLYLFVWIPYVWFLIRTIGRTILVDRYVHEAPSSIVPIAPPEVRNASINYELKTVDNIEPLAKFQYANAYRAVFDYYRHTKNGEYLAKQAYYTIMEFQLVRMLPHILFDSKRAKSQQFRYTYLKVQQVSVQGSFDALFATYVPETYAVDSLSFVSPEVMEALVQADEYDMEIINNKLLLYGPLVHQSELDGMLQKGMAVARQLNDNIDTYRDDRLTGQDRLQGVTPFARTLLRSPAKYIAYATVLGIASIAAIVGGVTVSHQIALNQLSLLVYILCIVNTVTAVHIVLQNRKALRQYHYLYETHRGQEITAPAKTAAATRY